MNLIGKICVVLILIMSLVFMTLAMAVYSTHKNWEEDYQAAKNKSDNQQTENRQLIARHDRLQRQLNLEVQTTRAQRAKLENERDQLIAENTEIQAELNTLRTREDDVRGLVAAAENNNQQLLQLVAGLQTQIQTEQSERDRFWEIAKEASLNRDQKLLELSTVLERSRQLTEEVARYTQYLREKLGLNPGNLPDGIAPRVRGEVLAVDRRNRELLIEVTIGSDDGLQAGHTLEIYRDRTYLGRAEIVRTAPDKSVGRVVFLNSGNIRVGDRVATHLRSTS